MDEHLAAAGSSQASLHSPGPDAVSSPVSPQKGGRGGHISALRSLGLLHELQEYVSACVETQQQQEKELGKLKAEKKQVERVLKQKVLRSADKQQPCLQQFQASEISELPPRLRALFEDNKVLKEQARRYKHRLQEAERHAGALEQQLLAAQASNSKLKAQLQEGDASGHTAVELAQARQQADGLNRALEKLQHAHQVLQQKLDTDARLHRQALATAGKDRQQLEQQVQELQEQLEAKDKEVRAHTLAAQQAQRKLDKIKASAHKAVAGVEARVAEAAAAAEARCRAMEDARVHLMLCIIKEPQAAGGTGRQQQSCRQQQLSLPGSEASHPGEGGGIWVADDSSTNLGTGAAGASNSAYTGSVSREQAVLKLQAGARGYLARKQIRQQRQQQVDALVLVQTGCQQQQQPEAATGEGTGQQLGPNSSNSQSPEPRTLSGAFSLPMELPALDPPATSSSGQLSSTAGGSQTGASSSSAAAAGGPSGTGPGRGARASSRQQGPSTGAAATAAAATGRRSRPSEARKPALPSFSRAPPASAPHQRSGGQHSSGTPGRGGSRSGLTSRTGAAPSTVAAEGVAAAPAAAAVAGSMLAASSSDAGAAGVPSAPSGTGLQPRSSSSRGSRAAAVPLSAPPPGRPQQEQQQHQRRQSLQPHPPGAKQQQQPLASSSSPRRVPANVPRST